MYVLSFVLSKRAPDTDAETGEISLGELSDGIFVADTFPTVVGFGGVVELAFDPEDSGDYTLQLGISEASVDESGEYGVEVVAETLIQMWPASENWRTPRIVALPFPAVFEIDEENDHLLWAIVVLDDQRIASLARPLLVRSSTRIPQFPEQHL